MKKHEAKKHEAKKHEAKEHEAKKTRSQINRKKIMTPSKAMVAQLIRNPQQPSGCKHLLSANCVARSGCASSQDKSYDFSNVITAVNTVPTRPSRAGPSDCISSIVVLFKAASSALTASSGAVGIFLLASIKSPYKAPDTNKVAVDKTATTSSVVHTTSSLENATIPQKMSASMAPAAMPSKA